MDQDKGQSLNHKPPLPTSQYLPMSQIHEAILAFDLARVKEILATSPEAANERDSSNLTPLMVLSSTTLHDLSYYAKLSKLKALGLVGEEAAEQVVRNKSLLVIENMAKAIAAASGVDLNAATPEEAGAKTALHIAAAANNEDLVNVLIDAKADLNKQEATGRTALMDAASFAVRRAIAYAGADLTIQDVHGNNVLHYILSQKIPDTPSSSMIALMCPHTLNVENKAGRTPKELAEATAKEVNEIAKAQLAADKLRPKREWEESFESASAAASGTMEEMISAGCPIPIVPKVQAIKKQTCWSKFIAAFVNIFCCCVRRQSKVESPGIPKIPTPWNPPPQHLPQSLTLSATTLIYGSTTKPTGPYKKEKEALLRSDPVKGEFVPHAGPCLGECDDDAEAPAGAPAPAPVASGAEVPIHRQTNFTSEDEVVSAPAAPAQQQQIEKDMDEVFAILSSASKPKPTEE